MLNLQDCPPSMTLAVVLHTRQYADSSLLAELLVAGQGRLPAILRGARRQRGKTKTTRSALLQPFRPLFVSLSGRGEVKTISRIEEAGTLLPLQGKFLLTGFYLNELLMRLLPREDSFDRIFQGYLQMISHLSFQDNIESELRFFELTLLEELGYQHDLEKDALTGEAIETQAFYQFVAELGLIRHTATEDTSASVIIQGATLQQLAARQPLTAAQEREARKLLRAMLTPLLGSQPLRSRELYRQWFATNSRTDS